MDHLIPGVFVVASGLGFIVCAEPIATFMIRGQNRTWGFHFGDRTRRQSVVISRFMGVLWIAFGVWTIVFG